MSKIVVVDDRAQDREFLAGLLRYVGHDVLEAADGAMALRLTRSEAPDLVISDVLLPEMDGYGLVQELRADPATARTPVIFYTAMFNEHEARQLARDCGVACVLAKPADPEKILAAVAEVLGVGNAREVSPLSPRFAQKHQQLLIDKLMHQVEALHRSEERYQLLNENLEAQIRERTLELELKNKELQEFSYIASHDLQEPLRKVQAFGQRLRDDHAECLGDQGRDFLKRIERAAGRMQNLINDLLEYSRATAKTTTHVLTDLRKVASEAMIDLEQRIEETGGWIDIDALPSAHVDTGQMRQLFQNLFSNSLKYHGSEPPRIKVHGEVVHEDGREMARISIQDNGIGFEEQYLDRIFQPFQRLHGKGRYEGTGIGLAIVRKIVERHRGTITARSEPGQGSTFIVTLPLRQAAVI